jgi:hypothetical protein
MFGNIKAQYANLKLRFLRWRMASYIRDRKIGGHISYYAVSIIGILAAVSLYTPIAQQAIKQYKNVDICLLLSADPLGRKDMYFNDFRKKYTELLA